MKKTLAVSLILFISQTCYAYEPIYPTIYPQKTYQVPAYQVPQVNYNVNVNYSAPVVQPIRTTTYYNSSYQFQKVTPTFIPINSYNNKYMRVY